MVLARIEGRVKVVGIPAFQWGSTPHALTGAYGAGKTAPKIFGFWRAHCQVGERMSARHFAAEDESGMTLCINTVGQTAVHFYWQIFDAKDNIVKTGDQPERFIPFSDARIMHNMMEIARTSGYKFKMRWNNQKMCDCGDN